MSSSDVSPSLSLPVDALIRRRVLSRDSELSGVLSRWRQYSTARSQSQPHLTVEAYQSLLQSIDALHFSIARQSLIHSSLDSDTAHCDEAAATSRRDTVALRSDIAQLKLHLEHATAERLYRVQVDSMAAQCNSMVSRAATDSLCGALQADIAQLEAEQSAMETEQESRRKQFALLALALDSVSAQWRQQYSSRTDNTQLT